MKNTSTKKLGRDKGDTKNQLEGEYSAVQNGDLTVYPVKTGIENLVKNMLTCRVVIVSTSLVKTSRLILEKSGVETSGVDFYDMSDFGSKKDKNAWKKIFEKYESVDYIVEDGKNNLEAAKEAAVDLGFRPKLFTSMPKI